MAILIENIKDELSIRLFNVLKRQDIKILEELTLYTDYDIHYWKNAGRKTSKEIDKVMRRYNLHLGHHANEVPSIQAGIIAEYKSFGPAFKECTIKYIKNTGRYLRGTIADSGPEDKGIYFEENDALAGGWHWEVQGEAVLYSSYYRERVEAGHDEAVDENILNSFEEADADFCKFYRKMKRLSRSSSAKAIFADAPEEKPEPKSRRSTMWESIGSGRKKSRGSHVRITEKDILVQAAEFGDVPAIPHETVISGLVRKGQLKASASEPGAYVITAAGRKALPTGNPKRRKKKAAPSPAKTLISKCQKAWKHYCERPGKKRLKEVFAHLEKMEKSSAKTVKAEMRRCRRSAKDEAKRLGMKF